MQPTLNPGQRVFVDTIYYKENLFKHGELVAIKFSNRKQPMVKRIIAIAGDSVTINKGKIQVNGLPLKETYLPEPRILPEKAAKLLSLQLSRYNNRIPESTLIVMGDNIKNSFDSGDYGFISKSQVTGKVYFNIKQ